MKITTTLAVAVGLAALAGCNQSPKEQAAENVEAVSRRESCGCTGTGPVVEGPAEALLMGMAGRRCLVQSLGLVDQRQFLSFFIGDFIELLFFNLDLTLIEFAGALDR